MNINVTILFTMGMITNGTIVEELSSFALYFPCSILNTISCQELWFQFSPTVIESFLHFYCQWHCLQNCMVKKKNALTCWYCYKQNWTMSLERLFWMNVNTYPKQMLSRAPKLTIANLPTELKEEKGGGEFSDLNHFFYKVFINISSQFGADFPCYVVDIFAWASLVPLARFCKQREENFFFFKKKGG